MRLSGWTLVGLLVLVSVLLDGLGLSWAPSTAREDSIRMVFVFALLVSQANLLVAWAVLGDRPAPPWRCMGLLIAFAAWIWALEADWPAGAGVQMGGHILLLPQIVATGGLLLIVRWAGFRVTDVSANDSLIGAAPGLRWWQFSLGALLAGALALGVVLGMPDDFPSVTLGQPSFTELVDMSFELWVVFGGNALVALVALWTALGTRQPSMRIATLALAVAGVNAVLLTEDFAPLPRWFLPALCLGQTLLLVGLLAVLRAADYRLAWRPYGWRAVHG